MGSYPLEVRTREHDAATRIYELSGNLFGNPAGYVFQDEVRASVASTKRVVIDFSEVRRIDSCGVGILASITMSARNASAKIVLASLPPHVEKVLGLTWFLNCVDHAPTVDDALARLDTMDPSQGL